jgi:hypothetical protein
MKPMLRRNYVGKESNCSGGKEKERQGRERSRAVESARKRLACVSFFLFIFSVFHYLKKKKKVGGPARAGAQASRAVESPMYMVVIKNISV